MKLRFALLALAASFSLRAADDVSLSAVVNIREADYEHARPALDKNAKNQPLRIGGREFATGVGLQVDSLVAIDLKGATRFTVTAGIDDATQAPAAIRVE